MGVRGWRRRCWCRGCVGGKNKRAEMEFWSLGFLGDELHYDWGCYVSVLVGFDTV